jgi:phage tail sheath protein FI
MSTSFLSPGVYVREIDFSLYASNLSTTSVGCVGYATKGPINNPQYVTNPVQFATVFGDPDLSMSGPYAALQFLAMGRQLWYVRVAETNEAENPTTPYLSLPATVTLKEAATKAKVTGRKTNLVSMNSSNNVLTFKVDGTSSVIDITWALGGATTITKSISEIVNELNKNNNFSAYFLATLSPTGALSIERILPGNSHGFSIIGSGLTNIFGSTFVVNDPPIAWGTGTIAEKASILGNTTLPATVTVPSAATLTLVVDGTNRVITFPTHSGGTIYTQVDLLDFLNTHSIFTTYELVATIVAGALYVTFAATQADPDVNKMLMLGGSSGSTGDLLFGSINAAKYMVGTSAPNLVITSANKELLFKTVQASDGTFNDYKVTLTPGDYSASQKATTTLTATGTIGNTDTVTLGAKTYTFKTNLTGAAAIAASGTLTSTGTAPDDGDQVLLGVRTYTFKTTLTTGGSVAWEVFINGSAANALANLALAVNAGSGAGTEYGTGTTANATIEAATPTATTLLFTARTAGVAGNSLATTTPTNVGATLSFDDTTLLTGADLVATVANEVHIGGSDASALDNLLKAVNFGTGIGTDYSTGTVINATVTATVNTNTTQGFEVKTAGTAGNATASQENTTGARLAFPATTFATPGTGTDSNDGGDLVLHIEDRLKYATDGSLANDGSLNIFDLSGDFTTTLDTTLISMVYTGAKDYVVYDVTGSAFKSVFGQNPVQKYKTTVSSDVLTATATSDGTWGNKLAVVISNVDAVNDTFDLNVFERGFLVERYEKLVKTPSRLTDPITGIETDNPKFLEHAINGISSRITVVNDITTGETLLPSATAFNTTVALTGGNDGVAAITNPSTFIGISDATVTTGLQLFRNPEQVDVNVIMAPGIASAPVINAMFDICNFRHDCMALVDTPLGLRPQQVVDWVNGTGDYANEHAAFNTSLGATYWPWLQIYDPVNQQLVWTPPSGHLSYVYAFTDYNSETWFAPAGLNRGHLSTPVKTEYIPTLGERDLLYQNNINPIATFIKDGINVWGQKTLQRTPTALDRVNVRRLMLYLEKVVATSVRTINFEPSDRTTWIQVINLIEPFLESVKSRRGVTEFKIVCDETTNTKDVIDRNEMNIRIFIRPTKTAEFISVNFIITDSGTAFTELVF